MVEGSMRRMISLAIDDELLGQLDRVMSTCRYTSRSRAVRDALRLLVAEKCDPAQLKGRVRGTVTLLTGTDVDLCPLSVFRYSACGPLDRVEAAKIRDVEDSVLVGNSRAHSGLAGIDLRQGLLRFGQCRAVGLFRGPWL